MSSRAGNAARSARTAYDPSSRAHSDSLLREVQTAADAAILHARTVAATASAEARLSAASAASIAAAAVAALLLLLVTWICLLALGVWLAIQAGLPVWAALTGAILLNLAGILVCRLMLGRLLPNLGFARTRSLLGAGASNSND